MICICASLTTLLSYPQAITALVIAPLLFIDRRANYYATCITEHTQALMSILSCFDWNKSYW